MLPIPLIEIGLELHAIEIKSTKKADHRMFRNLVRFEQLVNRPLTKWVVFQGDARQKFDAGFALPFRDFLDGLSEMGG